MMRKLNQTDAFSRRLRLSTREIAVALALTLAAVSFLAATVKTSGPDLAGHVPIESGRSVKAD